MRVEDPTVDSFSDLFAADRPVDGELDGRCQAAIARTSLLGDAPQQATVGRFVIAERIGQGGLGVVYAATDPSLDRRVAIKIVRSFAPAGSDRARAGLVQESRALARVDHPNVVEVYDVGWEGDHVYIAMELVNGETLRRWLDTPRTWQRVVRRYVAAGRGLAATHRAGLIHCDFKPDNILVGPGAQTKVVDYGLARVLGQTDGRGISVPDDGEQRSVSSADGRTSDQRVVGTPRYMSPEQRRGGALTPATDQYSFCVALAEGLAGAIGTPPPRIAKTIARGLATDPADRWPSTDALLDALADDPAKRRSWRVLGIGAVASVGLAGALWSVWSATGTVPCSGAEQRVAGIWDPTRRAEVESAIVRTELPYANEAWRSTAAALDGYATEWMTMHTEVCEATMVRAEQSSAVMDLRMACLHRAKVELAAVTQVLADADEAVTSKATELVGNLPPLRRCADVEALQVDVAPPSPAEAPEVEQIRALLAQAWATRLSGRYPAARATLDEAKRLLASVDYGPVHTEAALEEGWLLTDLGDYDGAETSLREALSLGATWLQPDQMLMAATSLSAVVGTWQGRVEEGLRYSEFAQRLAKDYPHRQAAVHDHLAAILIEQGKYPEAEAEFRRALALRESMLGPDDPGVATARTNIASMLARQGKAAEAETEHRRALASLEHALGAEHPDVARTRDDLGTALYEQGAYAEAEAAHRQALAGLEAALGPDHPSVAKSRNNLANTLGEQGEHAQSEAEHRRALASLERTLGADHPAVAISRLNVGNALRDQDKHAEAEREHRQALETFERTLGADHPYVAASRQNLASVLLKRGDAGGALQLAELAWERRQRNDTPLQEQAETLFMLARALWARESESPQRERARSFAERALAAYTDSGDGYAKEAAYVRDWLGAREPR